MFGLPGTVQTGVIPLNATGFEAYESQEVSFQKEFLTIVINFNMTTARSTTILTGKRASS